MRPSSTREPERHEPDSRGRRTKLPMNGVDAAEELCGDILPALVAPDRVGAKGVAVSFLARSMNVLDRPTDGKPFAAEAPTGLCVQCAVHLVLPRWPLALASPSGRALAAAMSRSISNAA